MDRLLEGKELDLLPLAEYTKQLLKAQDAKTAHLVATQIFRELEEAMTFYPELYFIYKKDLQSIKERHGVKE